MTKILEKEELDSLGIEGTEVSMPEQEKKIYNRWRLRILFSIILGYGTYYLCRHNFSIIMPSFMEEFGYSKTDLGWVLSFASVVYGIGKFVNGCISDQSNSRYFMSIGLACSAVVTFFLGFSDGIFFFGVLWVLNNWFQSMGWPPSARMLTHWYSQSELGTKWSLAAASHQIGGGITLIFAGYLVTNYGWRYAFFVPAIIAGLVAVFLFNRLRESPKELGLPTVETYKIDVYPQDSLNIELEEETDHISSRQIIKKVFCNRNIWFISCANMCVYIVRMGVIFWAPLFLQEYRNMSLSEAGFHVAAYEMVGLLGGYFAGVLSDKLFKGQRGIVGALFMLSLAANLFIFWNMPSDSRILSALLLILVGFFVYGPQVLIGVASADFASKKAVGTANGLVGSMAYVGSGFSGVCVGILLDNYGWSAAFAFFVVAAVVGALMFLLTVLPSKVKS